MAKQLITDYFRLNNAKQLRESITEAANTVYYIFAGRHTPYANGDSSIADPINSVEEISVDSYRNMVFGKRVTSDDVKIMVPRHDWTSNTVYTPYRSNTDLSNAAFYAVTNAASSYHVFKVLDNNSNTASTDQPQISDTSADDEYYSTSDGYVWKYMYSITKGEFDKFATADFIPVIPNANVTANAVSGAIDVITISNKGSNYDAYIANTFNSTNLRIGGDTKKYGLAATASANNDFYNDSYIYIKSGTGIGQIRKILDYNVVGTDKIVTIDTAFETAPDTTSAYEVTPAVSIVGDGGGARARALVNSAAGNSIYRVEIINRGYNYSFATATVQGNTGGVSNAASLSVVVGPKGGHGADPEYELGGRYVGCSVSFANNEANTIPTTNDYRTIGLLKDPLFANVEFSLSSVIGIFASDEVVTQANSNAYGVVSSFSGSTLRLSNVSGQFIPGKIVTGATSNATANVVSFEINDMTKDFSTFDQRTRYVGSVVSGTFTPDEKVYQSSIELSNGVFHSIDSNYIYLTDVRGTINSSNALIGVTSSATANLVSVLPPDLVIGSGEVLYIENTDPISRSNNQTEVIKIIMKF
jgi:hypothetical protein